MYSVSDIPHYFEFIIEIHEKFTNNLPIRIYVNIIESKITVKIKTGFYLELLTPETMALYENVPHLEVIEIILFHYILFNSYQQTSRVVYTFVPNKSFGQLLEI